MGLASKLPGLQQARWPVLAASENIMNIFATHWRPRIAASWLDDKRIGKALIECNQMMSTAILRHNPDCADRIGDGKLCCPTHENHPVTLWVGANSGNFYWTLAHACALADEFEMRFRKQHGSAVRTHYIGAIDAGARIPAGGIDRFQNSARNGGLGFDFTEYDVHIAYRRYLTARWLSETPKWTNSAMPEWWFFNQYNMRGKK